MDEPKHLSANSEVALIYLGAAMCVSHRSTPPLSAPEPE